MVSLVHLAATAPAQARSARATTVGAYVQDTYAHCPHKPVKVDLWFHNGTAFELHNRCYLNAANAPSRPGVGVCYFKYAMPVGTPAGSVLVRSWKMNAECTQYLDAVAPTDPSSYIDFHPVSNVLADEAYDAHPRRLIHLQADTWSAAIDRNGGAIYEFHSKRAKDTSLPQGKTENAVHAHFGAALQFAIHNGALGSLTSEPCAEAGYWNPTQAGCACSWHGGVSGPDEAPAPGSVGLQIHCDGVLNNACTSASQTIEHSLHTMMSWDYGPGYEGPYNALDTSQLAQKATAHPNFLQVDVRLVNSGQDRMSAWETPTFYFNNRFRRFYHPDGLDGITQVTIPPNLTGLDDQNYQLDVKDQALLWITFENTGLSSGGDHFITIGMLLGQALLDDLWYHYFQVLEGDYFDNIKFTYAPRANYRQNVEYAFRYVIFPYRYNETVTTSFGNMSVADTIAAMNADYLGQPPDGGAQDGGVKDSGTEDASTEDASTAQADTGDTVRMRSGNGSGCGCAWTNHSASEVAWLWMLLLLAGWSRRKCRYLTRKGPQLSQVFQRQRQRGAPSPTPIKPANPEA